jgi:AraC family transcriptional regulator of arabinose operon
METPAALPGVLVAGHFDQGADYAVRRWAGTHDWLLTYTLAGVGRFRSGGGVFYAQPGDVTLLPPGVPHDYAVPAGGRWVFLWVHFLPRPTWLPWLQLPRVGDGLCRMAIASPTGQQRIAAAFKRLLLDVHADHVPGMVREELALNALEEMLLVCLREVPGDAATAFDPRVHAVLELLATNLPRTPRIADLAAQAALSPSRLAHLFKAQVGDSVLETLLRMRVRQAARLLTYTTQNVTEISRTVGFHSPYYFSRQFHQHFGLSPTAYRAKTAVLPREAGNPDASRPT